MSVFDAPKLLHHTESEHRIYLTRRPSSPSWPCLTEPPKAEPGLTADPGWRRGSQSCPRRYGGWADRPRGGSGHAERRLRTSPRIPEAQRGRGRKPGRTGKGMLVRRWRDHLPGRATRPAVLRRRVGRDRDRGRIARRAEDDRRPRPARVHGGRLAVDRPPRRHLGLCQGGVPGLLRQPGRAASGDPGDPRPQRQAARGVPDAPDHAGTLRVSSACASSGISAIRT